MAAAGRADPDSPPAIFLMGPTASGKTDLAVAWARVLPVEIVSVDSGMVYRGMDIGTAKPDADTLRRAPHRLIDLHDPDEPYSAGRFRADALQAMADIHAAGRIPLLVGGTMMYFRALLHGLAQLPGADARVRAELEARARRDGWAAMHAELARIDPAAAARIHPNDPQRIQRALEVHVLTGESLSRLQEDTPQAGLPYRVLKLAPRGDSRAQLHERIEQRFEAMLAQGLVQEVEELRARFRLHTDLPSMRSVGYRQVWAYLEGELTYDQMRERGIIATRQLAKRQFTWLRSEPDLHWIDSRALGQADRMQENLANWIARPHIFEF